MKYSFSLILSLALTAPSFAQIYHGTVEVTQNDAGNTTTSVTTALSQGSSPNISVNTSLTNRADYFLNFPLANASTAGVLISSVAENGRDNSANGDPSGTFYPTSSAAAAGSDYYIAVHRYDATENSKEFNINTAFGYFPVDDWLAGRAEVSTNGGPITSLVASAGIDLGTTGQGQEFTDNDNGIFDLNLRSLDGSSQSGILLVNGARNEDNYALSSANSSGTFTIYCHDNGAQGSAYEQDPVSFVYIPQTAAGTKGITAMGRVRNSGVSQISGGHFSMAKPSTGVWHLVIPGLSPDDGTLLISPEALPGGNSIDNAISYEYIGTSTWAIESRDIPGYGLQKGSTTFEPMFSFAFFLRQLVSYVNPAATSGNNDGTSWEDAFLDLQDALEAAVPGRDIWVAAGTYYPDEGAGKINDDRSETFSLTSGTRIYGGFPNTGNPGLDDRDPATNTTVLSGDIDQNDGTNFANNAANAYNVLIASGDETPLILDGFTISGGNASSHDGGGLRIAGSANTSLIDCSFNNNFSAQLGGAIHHESSQTLTLSGCTFEGNTSRSGGAISSDSNAALIVENGSFIGNSASIFAGGAIYTLSRATINNCSFQGNAVTNQRSGSAGAIYIKDVTSLDNCSFTGNSALLGGALLNASDEPTILTNCSFQGNSASFFGGAIYQSAGSTRLTNCVIWNNAAGSSSVSPSASLFTADGNNPSAVNCLIENFTSNNSLGSTPSNITGSSNFDGTDSNNDPLFAAKVNPLSAPISGGDLRLLSGSPIIDEGGTNGSDAPTDLAGNQRVQNGIIDIGAYEGAYVTFAHLGFTNPDGDDNNNGLSNYTDYALGADPTAPFDSKLQPSIDGSQLTFSYRDYAADVFTQFQKSETLLPSSWTEMIKGNDYSIFSEDENGVQTTLTLQIAPEVLAEDAKLFFRQAFSATAP